MAVCWISFRIAKKDVGGKTYEQRYSALEQAIDDISTTVWKETTSFIIFETSTSFETAANNFKATIAPSTDLFLMRQMETKKATICGKYDDEDIFDLMVDAEGTTYLKKL